MLDKNIENINSPGSINTIGQTGGINTVVNYLDLPEPNFSFETLSKNILVENGYQSEFMLKIDTKIAINNLYIKANAPNIISMNIGGVPFIISGHSGITNEFAFHNIFNAFGSYRITIITKEKQQITFELVG